MYKHVLIPTDGSEFSDRAIEAGIAFARDANARVTGFTAVPEYKVPSQIELMSKHGVSMPQYEEDARRQAEAALLHGSETRGVLAHSRIPTLVYR